uniref:DUF4130 domain-containing protein n=1 Tax=Phocaeicola coprophilus TaxID=387090 RepID=UPI00307A7376
RRVCCFMNLQCVLYRMLTDLWKSYFKTVCIRERLNPVKHRKDMPVRYWKYLTEKR